MPPTSNLRLTVLLQGFLFDVYGDILVDTVDGRKPAPVDR